MTYISILLLIVFLAGIYTCFYNKSSSKNKEGFGNKNFKCPNLLIQKGCKIYLQNTEMESIPGVNPIEFENLNEYVTYLKWQRNKGIECPVLFFQQSYDTQGDAVYTLKDSPNVSDDDNNNNSSTVQFPVKASKINNPNFIPIPESHFTQNSSLINAERDNPPYNQNFPASFDPSSFYIGLITPLDEMNKKAQGMPKSGNAMDTNWGGDEYTEELIDQGKYKGNNVAIMIE